MHEDPATLLRLSLHVLAVSLIASSRKTNFFVVERMEEEESAGLHSRTDLPEKEWGSDPVFWSKLKLFVRDIYALEFYDKNEGTRCSVSHSKRINALLETFIFVEKNKDANPRNKKEIPEERYSRFYKWGNHPVIHAEIVGVLVGIAPTTGFIDLNGISQNECALR